MFVQPYLFFDGRCEEALAFYQTAIGAQVNNIVRFEGPPAPATCAAGVAGTLGKVLHTSFYIGESEFMATDGQCNQHPEFKGVILTLIVETEDQVVRFVTSLSAGGTVHVPAGRTYFSGCFGMVTDKFGVQWMIMLPR